jgi:hypothetical protein
MGGRFAPREGQARQPYHAQLSAVLPGAMMPHILRATRLKTRTTSSLFSDSSDRAWHSFTAEAE